MVIRFLKRLIFKKTKDEGYYSRQYFIEMQQDSFCPRCGIPLGGLNGKELCFNCGLMGSVLTDHVMSDEELHEKLDEIIFYFTTLTSNIDPNVEEARLQHYEEFFSLYKFRLTNSTEALKEKTMNAIAVWIRSGREFNSSVCEE